MQFFLEHGVNPWNGLNGARICDSRRSDRHADHAKEKYVAIGVIACARAIPPKIFYNAIRN